MSRFNARGMSRRRAARDRHPSTLVCRLTHEEWDAIVENNAEAAVLNAAEEGGAEAVRELLASIVQGDGE